MVRVNDRGPFVRGRIIDLSWGAARELGMISQGIATVIVEPADEIVIPLRPIEKRSTLPMLMVGSSLNKDSIMPVWQEKLQIDHRKIQHHMNRTAQKSLWERISNYLNE
jgi:rare lipoprotein A